MVENRYGKSGHSLIFHLLRALAIIVLSFKNLSCMVLSEYLMGCKKNELWKIFCFKIII